MNIPKKVDLRTAIILFILAIVLTVSGASVLFDSFSREKATGMASASVGISISKPSDDTDDGDDEEPPGTGGQGAGSGAGGGGGGGAGGGLKPKILRFQKDIELTKGSGQTLLVPDHVETTIRFITLDLLEDLEESKFKVQNYGLTAAFVDKPTKPAIVATHAPGVVYSYVNVEIGNLDPEDTEDIWLNFHVSKNWIKKRMIGEDTIVLYRYHNKEWVALETKRSGSNSEYINFKAQTPGFSVFAVSGSVVASQIHIVFMPNLTLYRGDKTSQTVVVENIGDADLSNLRLSATAEGFDINVTPFLMEALPVGSKGTFIATIAVEDDASPGNYGLLLRTESTESSAEIFSNLYISPEEKPAIGILLSEQINNLKSTTNEVWIEAQWLGLKGGNVTGIFALLNSAKNSLEKASETFGMVDFDETSRHVETARSYLEKAVIEMGKQQPFLKFLSFSAKTILIIVCVILILGSAGYMFLYKYKGGELGKRVFVDARKLEKTIKVRVTIDEKKRTKLVKQLSLIEEAYHKGHIKKKLYEAEKKRLKDALSKLK